MELEECEIKVLEIFLSFADKEGKTTRSIADVKKRANQNPFLFDEVIGSLRSKKLIVKVGKNSHNLMVSMVSQTPISDDAVRKLRRVLKEERKKTKRPSKQKYVVNQNKDIRARECHALGIWRYDVAGRQHDQEDKECANYERCLTFVAIHDGNWMPCPGCSGSPPWSGRWMDQIITEFYAEARNETPEEVFVPPDFLSKPSDWSGPDESKFSTYLEGVKYSFRPCESCGSEFPFNSTEKVCLTCKEMEAIRKRKMNRNRS